MPVGEAKVRMRTVDHCTIYLLIAGTYTPATLTGVWKADETMAWIMFAVVWGLLVPAVILTAIDTKKFLPISMACYVVMGWCVAIDFPAAIEGLGGEGFAFLLSGGIAYTVGAVVYGIGKKLRYMHSVFHILVLAGSILQFISIYAYALR
jgi:hemolysin III